MVDVTRDKFKELYPQLLTDIKSSSFVAIDTEFTGLLADSAFRGNLFDDGPQRYEKLRSNLRRFSICQLGLAVFTGIPDANTYSVTTYNFYLRPHSCASCDPVIMCQTSSLEFLQKFQFDFNKWIYEGVGCINHDEAQELDAELKSLFSGRKEVHMSYEIEDCLRDIGKWASEASEGSVCTLPVSQDTHSLAMLLAALHNRFSNVWTSLQDEQVVMRKASYGERVKLEAQDPERMDLVEPIMKKTLGFTELFDYLVEMKKPIVLHNCLLDLMLIYKQFCRKLPSSYSAFKSDIHTMFPVIYDTKFVAEQLRSKFRDQEKVGSIFNKSGLGELTSALKGELPVIYVPKLSHQPPGNKYTGDNTLFHEAGYDAFLTGFCFLRMSHLCAMIHLPMLNCNRPLSPREHLATLKEYANKIHLQRSALRYMSLNGNDPESERPPWLLVEGQERMVRVSPSLVSTVLAKYKHLDIRPHNNNSVLVATASWRTLSDILANLSKESPLKARVYRRLHHSYLLRGFMWSGALVSLGLSTWMVYNTCKKSSP